MKNLSGAWQLIVLSWHKGKKHYNAFFQPIVILILISILNNLVTFYTFEPDALYNAVTGIFMLALIVISIWITIIAFRLAWLTMAEKKFTLAEIYRDSWRRLSRVFLVGFTGFIIAFIAAGIVAAVIFGLVSLNTPSGILGLVSMLLGALLIVFLVYIYVLFTLAATHAAIESAKVMDSIKAMREALGKKFAGVFWRLFAPQLFWNVIIGIIIVGSFAIITGGQLTIESFGEFMVENFWLNSFIVIISTLFMPFVTYPIVALYKEVR